MTGNVGRLNLENFKYTRVPGVEQAVVKTCSKKKTRFVFAG